MTDDVPVSDVLLEATEYLCKLGSNLKLRSENLKEKRISRSKLKNTHAVQKAADKLLLICELSKKSLENVEVGVKKILRVCARDQGPIPVKPASFKREIEYFYIKDGSNKLRMSQKISLAHFKSVKVKAKSMSLSKQEKYPVYFDCKLYRRRKKKESEARLKKLSKNNMGSSESGVKSFEIVDKIEFDAEEDEKSQKHRSSEEQDNKVSSSSIHSSTENHEEIREDEQKSKTKSECDNSTKYDEKEKYHSSKSESKSDGDSKDPKEKSGDIKEDKPGKPQTNVENLHYKKDKDQSESRKKKKHARIVDDSSDEQLSEVVDNSPKKPSDNEEMNDSVKDSDESKRKKHTKLVDSSDEEGLKVKKKSLFDKENSPDTAEDSSDDSHTHKKRRISHQIESSDEDKKDKELVNDGENVAAQPQDIKEDKTEKPQTNVENLHDDKDQSGSTKKKNHARIVDDSSDEQLSEVVDDLPKKPSDNEELNEAVKNSDDTKKNEHVKIVDSSDEGALKVKKESSSKLGDKKSNPDATEERNEAKIIKSEGRREKTHDENINDFKNKHGKNEIHDSEDDQPVKEIKHRACHKENSIESVEDSSDDAHIHKKRKLQMESSDEKYKKEKSRNRQIKKHGEKSYDKRDKEKSKSKKKKHFRIVEDSSDEQLSEVVETSPRKPSDNEKSLETIKDSSDTKKKPAESVDSSEEYASEVKKESPSKLARRRHEAKRVELRTTKEQESKDKTDDEENENRDESQNKHCKRAILDSSDDQHVEEQTNRTFDKENSPETVEDSSDDSHRHKKRKNCHQMESSDEGKKDKESVNDGKNPAAQPQKPLLKLVDLSKLLKPDILQASSKKNESLSQPASKNIKPELSRKERKLQEKKIKEENFWVQKRKEVLAFKPKKFHVSVCRLPEFNNDFLVRNKIVKITRLGETIAARSNDKTVTFQVFDKEDQLSDKSPSDTKAEVKENVSTNFIPDMNKVKSALLDSDSDKEEDTAVILAEAEKVKKSLLNDTDDSDSDGNIKEKKQSELSVINCKESELKSTAITNENILVATETNTIDLLSKDRENQMQSSDNEQLHETEPSKVTENQESSSKTTKNNDVTPVGSDNEKSLQTQSDKVTEKLDETKPSKAKKSSSEIGKNIDTTPVGSDTEKSKQAQSSDKESEKPDETELPKVTEQESSSETSKNKDTTPVGSDKEKKSPEKSPITPRSKKKRKNMMESMHAKKMLLTYSSSSDTEDEQLKDAIKEIKNSLLEGSDEDVIEKVRDNHRKKLVASSSDDDDDDDVPIIQKRKGCEEPNKISDNETRDNNDENSSQVDAKADEDNSSSSKVSTKEHKIS